MNQIYQPAWMAKYANGERMSKAQAYAEYAAYYCMDGTADSEPGIEERIEPSVPFLRPYASRTGTKTTLANMRRMGWSILVSAAGVLRTEGFDNWALDNGAWSAFQQGFVGKIYDHANREWLDLLLSRNCTDVLTLLEQSRKVRPGFQGGSKLGAATDNFGKRICSPAVRVHSRA